MDETRDRHPSYGMIGAGRWQAGGRGRRLFGSALPGHNSGITLRIHEAEAIDRDGHVRTYARNLIAEVHLSPVQWAELLTSMNRHMESARRAQAERDAALRRLDKVRQAAGPGVPVALDTP